MGWEKYSGDFLLLRRDPVPLVNIEHGCQNEVKGEMDNQEKKALKEILKIFLAKKYHHRVSWAKKILH